MPSTLYRDLLKTKQNNRIMIEVTPRWFIMQIRNCSRKAGGEGSEQSLILFYWN